MTSHYGATAAQIESFLRRASDERLLTAKQATLLQKAAQKSADHNYSALRTRWQARNCRAEAKLLQELASEFSRKR